MKKKIGIGLGILIVLIIGIIITKSLMSSKKVVVKEENPYGIEYYTVPDVEQVFINGVVNPEQSQEFRKEEQLGQIGEIKVANGDTVESGALLYTYENKGVTKQINDLNNQVARMETQKANAGYKLNIAIKKWEKTPQEERTQTLEELKMDMSTNDTNAEIKELYNNIESMKKEQYTDVQAPFNGKVYIPEVKDANSAILKLISDKFHVSGTVNERDITKLAIEQVADIKVISNDKVVTGKVSFIDLNPSEGNDKTTVSATDGLTMSRYPVKLSLDSIEDIRNGYHVQAVVNIGKEEITIPTVSIHKENDQSYVLVNDFGTVVRRIIQLGEEQGDNVVVTSGLEAEDQIIITSKQTIKEGQVLSKSSELKQATDELSEKKE